MTKNPMSPGMRTVLVLFILFVITSYSDAREYEGVKVETIAKSSTAYNGQKLRYLKTDKPEVTALKVEIPAGGQTGWHVHPVPVYAYMLSGRLSIEVEGGRTFEFGEGDVILEVMGTPHNGKTIGNEPVTLVVFYTGEKGSPTTMMMPEINRD